MARVLIAVSGQDCDPTEAAVPFGVLSDRGHEVVLATPGARKAECDPRMLSGEGLGIWSAVLRADAVGRAAWERLAASDAYAAPIAYEDAPGAEVDAVVFTGGHAPGMRPYLEDGSLQALAVKSFQAGRVVGAICHGVLILARARDPETGRSPLHGRRTTALLRSQELLAWRLTRRRLGTYYRTYPETTVQDEVTEALARPEDFVTGPTAILRDRIDKPSRGFTCLDGRYVSARWPGDAHRFALEIDRLLAS